ncbi:phage tail protein [Burkholderia metallica]|uniref:Phage tail protein n=1 Tax=Burkholderia metallica TaxID=488729 RepID=A0ABT8PF18_9BURK|nr:phage tail protein [Burkholderia metallica]MDN7933676.1 phage tail protein [Burkholderia metallica]
MDYPKSVPGVGLVDGKFVDENPGTGQVGSLVPAKWGNSVTDEAIYVIEAAGLEPDENSSTQLLEAIKIISSEGETQPPGDNSKRYATTEYVDRAVSDAIPSRIGEIVLEMRNYPREGWLMLNGVELIRTDYPALWAYAKESGAIVADADWGRGWHGCFSHGDGATSFRIPDLRGEFLRVGDHARGADRDRGIGTWQDSTNRAHAHTGGVHAGGNHVHGAWTDAQGHHSHHVNDPGHSHVIGLGSVGVHATAPGQGYGPHNGRANEVGSDGSGTGIWLNGDGSHGHNVGIGESGDHVHGLTINGDGADEARPRNIAISAFIRAY